MDPVRISYRYTQIQKILSSGYIRNFNSSILFLISFSNTNPVNPENQEGVVFFYALIPGWIKWRCAILIECRTFEFCAATICWDQTILINGGGVSGDRTHFILYNIFKYFYPFWPWGNSGIILTQIWFKSIECCEMKRLFLGAFLFFWFSWFLSIFIQVSHTYASHFLCGW